MMVRIHVVETILFLVDKYRIWDVHSSSWLDCSRSTRNLIGRDVSGTQTNAVSVARGRKNGVFQTYPTSQSVWYTPFNDESLLKSYFYSSPDSLASVHFLQNGNWWLYRWDFIGFALRFMFSQFFSTKYFGLKWYLKVIKRSSFLVSCSKTILLSGTSSMIEWKIVKVRLSTI